MPQDVPDPNDYEKDLHNRIEEDEDNANWVHAEDDYNHATDRLNAEEAPWPDDDA